MVGQGQLSPEAIQRLATDIGASISQSLGQSLSQQLRWTCTGSFDCTKTFTCSTFSGLVESPQGADRVGS